jgi:hypothetical protein
MSATNTNASLTIPQLNKNSSNSRLSRHTESAVYAGFLRADGHARRKRQQREMWRACRIMELSPASERFRCQEGLQHRNKTMSAAGTYDGSRSGLVRYGGRRRIIIGAHADHNRADFVFPRAQSLSLRTLPWETRLKPQRCWSEIALYSFVALMGATVLLSAVL